MSRILNKLESVNPWHFLWVTVILAEIFTAVINAIQSYLRWGFISYQLLAIGAIDALFVPVVVAPIIIIFVMRISKLKEDTSLQQEFGKALRESEKKYKDLAELLPQFAFETDDKGNIQFFNRFALENLQYTQDDFKKGLHALQMFIPEELDGVKENIQKVLRGEVLDGLEFTALKKDGTAFPVLLSASPIVHKNNITGIRGIAVDISERKRAEDKVKKAEKEWERTFDSITAPVMILDTHHKIIKANKAMADKLGVTPSTAVGLTCYKAVHGRSEPHALCPHSQLLADGQPHTAEIYEERLGGHYIVTVSPLFAPDGTLYGSVHYAADITERKRIEQDQQKFVALIENSSDFIGIASLEGHILHINRAGRKLVGLDSDEEAGAKMISDFFFEEDLHELETSMIPAGYWQGEFRLRHFKTGLEIPVDFTGFLIRDLKTGQPLAHATIIRDITERKRTEENIRKLNSELEAKIEERTEQLLDAQEELVRKEKLATLGQLAGSVGHELRNPLGVMSNAVYYLKTVMSGADENVKDYLNIIKTEVDGSLRIISDLLDFSRTRPPQVDLITVDELINQSLTKCAIPENITVQVNIPEMLPLLKVDPFQMVQVFQNLITNGLQAMPDGGELRISARRGVRDLGFKIGGENLTPIPHTPSPGRDFMEISITDTGEGISPENMKKLFQPLYTTKARGIGLGLIVSKNLTEANGGRIEVKSELGKGTTFIVALPLNSDNIELGT